MLVTSMERFAPVGQPLVQLLVPAQCKLGAASRVQAAAVAERAGLLEGAKP